ncbi:unnamed protein product [Hyaloperonospora brassicae]|uniref:BED-type domain-containing protein n=1 Tax=Hyaloperonospora brassicae TaxID=162125 RepID=A0AAV0T1Z8_HYABA|nr:unnamed protein product [Hyaloperonospora brassicae]
MQTAAELVDVAIGAALFDPSSYTGGAPLIPMDDSGSGDRETGDAAPDVCQELMDKSVDGEEKRMGRPSHPAWQYFVRGEKRNQFHHNAYCRLCRAQGVDAVAIRGVSGNMIRHLQKCVYCPVEVVTQLKLLCAQKDAANFNKRHQSPSRSSVDMLRQETTGALLTKKRTKKARWSNDRSEHIGSLPEETRDGEQGGDANCTQVAAGGDALVPLQRPVVSPETNAEHVASMPLLKPPNDAKQNTASSDKASGLLAPRQWPSAERQCTARGPQVQSTTGLEMTELANSDISADALSMSVMSSTLSAGLPWDWVWMEQSALLLGDVQSKIRLPSAELLSSIGSVCHDKQISKMKAEQGGVTLAVNSWMAKYPRTTFVLLSLVNAVGEATVWDLVDMGCETSALEGDLSDKIKSSLTVLQESGIYVINIVADTALAYAASRLAVDSSKSSSMSIPVLPCFSHMLQVLLGIVMTESDTFVKTVGEMVELVGAFSNHRVAKILQHECGDIEATLRIPIRQDWYSFIEAVDSVRQYEDMVKIVSSKVLQASSSDAAGQSSSTLHTDNLRKDSTGNTVDELLECGLPSHVIRTVQDSEFWENVMALSELMSPLKEAYKMTTSCLTSPCSLSGILYQFGRMQQQYEAIASDWEDVSGGCRSVEQVRLLLQKVNHMWKLYDHPLMILGYTFDYNLQQPFLALHQPLLQWLSIGKYAKQYFQSWFCAASSAQSSSRWPSLCDDAVAQFMEDVSAYKERKYPFDLESMCDFDKPKHFYVLVSDSHPLMYMFGSRLFSFATSTPPLSDLIPGKGFVSSTPSTTHLQQTLLPLLRMTLFARTATRLSQDMLELVQHSRLKSSVAHATNGGNMHEPVPGANDATSSFLSGMRSGRQVKASGADESLARLWNTKQWAVLARHWKAHWKEETAYMNRLQSQRVKDGSAPDIALDDVFKVTLPSRFPHDRDCSSAHV